VCLWLFSSFSRKSAMLASKRRRGNDGDESSGSEQVDISSALAGNRQRAQPEHDSEDELGDFIRTSIAKRDMKKGADVVKKAKGKTKLAKGEVGGGSFQSMGTFGGKSSLEAIILRLGQDSIQRCSGL
jgi:hypothetical protein